MHIAPLCLCRGCGPLKTTTDVINTAKVRHEFMHRERKSNGKFVAEVLSYMAFNIFPQNVQDIARGGEHLIKLARQIADAVSGCLLSWQYVCVHAAAAGERH